MNVILVKGLTGSREAGTWTEPRGVVANVLWTEPAPGAEAAAAAGKGEPVVFTRVSLGAAGVLLRRGDEVVGVPLEELMGLLGRVRGPEAAAGAEEAKG